jgi:4-hydroxy-tetrahydrodipicolinate synthase
MERLLDYVLAGGVHNVFVLGSNGEFPALGLSQLEQIVGLLRELLRARSVYHPLLVGIGAPSLGEALKRGRAAVGAGADALVACPPYYFIYSPEELQRYFLSLADALERPVILYNIPRYSNNPLTAGIVAALAGHPNIVGIKDSSGDEAQLKALLAISARQAGFGISQGAERRLCWAARLGVEGITPGLANVAPHLCVELWEAARGARPEVAECLQARLDALGRIHRIRSGVAGTKAALAELGLCGPTPAAPFVPLSRSEREEVRRILGSVGIAGKGEQSGAVPSS